jgi:ubiquinone/menaquinone biosynthesis C-methylase UbiE
MTKKDGLKLTNRQERELKYHIVRAHEHEKKLLSESFSWEILNRPHLRWWNCYWQMINFLVGLNLKDKRVLVLGCGFGHDTLLLAKLGAEVHGTDLSPESLNIAKQMASREDLKIIFERMPAEAMTYSDNFFQCILARDILHHVDITLAMNEICRVSKLKAHLVICEVYTHSFLDRFRNSRLVDKVIYPRLQSFIYNNEIPYITEDERKLNQVDIHLIIRCLDPLDLEKHFNLFVTRIVPDRFVTFSKIDRLLLILLRPIA